MIECGKLLQRAGYRIKVLNTINFKKSMHYNPFVYIRSEKDILKLVNTLIANTKGEGEKSAEDFWVKAERLLYCALVGYIWYEAPAEEMNFITLLELINASEAREDDEEYQSPVDLLFADLEERDPDHFAVKQYRKYKLAAGKTAKSILISCGARLAPFDIKELRDLMSYDELELDTLRLVFRPDTKGGTGDCQRKRERPKTKSVNLRGRKRNRSTRLSGRQRATGSPIRRRTAYRLSECIRTGFAALQTGGIPSALSLRTSTISLRSRTTKPPFLKPFAICITRSTLLSACSFP